LQAAAALVQVKQFHNGIAVAVSMRSKPLVARRGIVWQPTSLLIPHRFLDALVIYTVKLPYGEQS
jgi:hypothetical protein